MKSEIEVERELKLVRELLAEARAGGAPQSITNGFWQSQQALLWVLGRGLSPTETFAMVEKIAATLDD